MRVIGGSARGRTLASFAGRDIRPTPDRVREALFSILFSRYGAGNGGKVLDLFAGSGALGIEALSRAASHAWFIDRSPQAVATIRENLARCGLADRATVLRGDAWQLLPKLGENGPFDLVFADPPYGQEYGPRLLSEIARFGLLAAPHGLLCLESAPADPLPSRCGALLRCDQRRYGSTLLTFYQLEVTEEA